MRYENTLILERDDLNINGYRKPINKINVKDISISIEPILKSSLVLFIDNNGDTIILKNRWGNIPIKLSLKDKLNNFIKSLWTLKNIH
ncbi:MAG: hypothetical protein PHX62_04905 [Bacilli bacterium]|nr:hypothetical protein [Bacilli bacterium]